ncbi:heavy metal-responsive transcriptional regulator [Streptomyces sp. NPDC048350]|uniref:heavy metal-responsive transcriptional regulator n=1 Tax=Streptomyces sp. NPDC048350 TaxID=3365538 RepID=UPI00372455F1
MRTYRISQLAERSGVPATTLRFYETAGLLPAGRTASGYRVYGDDAVDRLAFISSAKLLGLALEEIRDLLEVREEGVCASLRARMLPLVADRIRETDGRVAELRAFSDRLGGVHAVLAEPAPDGACGPDCGCTSAPSATAAGPIPVTLSPTRPETTGSAATDSTDSATTGAAATGPVVGAEAATDAAAGDPVAGGEVWREAPVACTLDRTELSERTEQWRALVARAGRREEIDDGLRLFFPPDADLAGQIAALAAAEQGCCAFFDFTLHLTPGSLQLIVRAPESAAGMPARLFGAPA